MSERDPDSRAARLRALPAVDQLAAQIAGPAVSPAEAVSVARAVLHDRRQALLTDPDGSDHDLVADARRRLRPGPRRVLNATGVILHTNLGRAPLADAAAEAVSAAARGYLDLEYDLATGERGRRDDHVAATLAELTGAEDALVVNNGAAATLLAAAALAGPGRSIAVSRGQLVEIGGGFRVPEVIAQAGATLVEVGTTNRTRLADYAAAHPDVILRVHPSNFRTLGFVEAVPIDELTGLGPPVIDDLGSGVLQAGLGVRLEELLADEPRAADSIQAGTAVACFSGDKLLGGPQAGILVGTREAIAQCRRHPLARALRLGRLPLAALAATLALYRDPARAVREVPVLRMLDADPDLLARRARELADATGGEVIQATARVGGGALPLTELTGAAVALDGPDPRALAARLRAHDPPLVARIGDGRVIVDPRTLLEDELAAAVQAIRASRS